MSSTPNDPKSIEQIWPEAYETNTPVRLVGKTIKGAFTSAAFKCHDGRTYPLTKKELKQFMPNVKISRSFK